MPPNMYLPDALPLPMLNTDGSNWSIYKIRMTLFLRAKGLIEAIELTINPGGRFLSNNKPLDPSDWNQKQDAAKFIVASTIPDSFLLPIHHLATPKQMWDALAKECGQNLEGH
ncbi:hypothetical protein BOTBODRAFT_38771 [Botryobasidium botryosum FD-172 SS1]|uniref:UBN2_3 domain-containing protein n=1 Tax=Botryobasidium botryosum (strain FD-172 SS1) TaxID=930990 RepID=A0A067M7B2_BOTB1|nr:hypothetical protein BOTBODRAFT_38771 [Botryobasidium botryosum FD-172 SS1]